MTYDIIHEPQSAFALWFLHTDPNVIRKEDRFQKATDLLQYYGLPVLSVATNNQEPRTLSNKRTRFYIDDQVECSKRRRLF